MVYYKKVLSLDSSNIEAIACLGAHYFYSDQVCLVGCFVFFLFNNAWNVIVISRKCPLDITDVYCKWVSIILRFGITLDYVAFTPLSMTWRWDALTVH